MDTKYRDQFRFFLKDSIRKRIDFSHTDQNRGVAAAADRKAVAGRRGRIDLPDPASGRRSRRSISGRRSRNRESRRSYRGTPLTLEELASCSGRPRGSGRPVAGHAYPHGAVGRLPPRPGDVPRRPRGRRAWTGRLPLSSRSTTSCSSSSPRSNWPRELVAACSASSSRGRRR